MATATETMELTGAQVIENGRNLAHFIGRIYYLDYEKACVLVSDYWRDRVMGIPQGAFLLAYYDRDETPGEILLLRTLRPIALPSGDDRISGMMKYYGDELRPHLEGKEGFPSWEFSFSGLECRILGAFYKDRDSAGREALEFGSGAENIHAPASYAVYKPSGDVLEMIVQWRTDGQAGETAVEFEIGALRYRFRDWVSSLDGTDAPVSINPGDFPGKLTGIIGGGENGRANTSKVILETIGALSRLSEYDHLPETTFSPTLEAFNTSGAPYYPIGQIVFGASGAFEEDAPESGAAPLRDLFERGLTRFSLVEKTGHIVLKVNFYEDVLLGFELAKSFLAEDDSDYVRNFTQANLTPPEDDIDFGSRTRWARKRAAYLCCLYRAGFQPPPAFRIRFQGNNVLDKMVRSDGSIRPSESITFQQAVNWFSTVWDNYNSEYFHNYKDTHDGREWADEDLKAILVFLTRKRIPGGNAYVSGYRKLNGLLGLHAVAPEKPFHRTILEKVREGGAVIVDLSRGDPGIGQAYTEIISREIFNDSMVRFIRSLPNNFIQFYFEKAHELFPREGNPAGVSVYDRIAREGRKLRLGMTWLSPQITGLSEQVLANTRNWLVSRLPCEDELAALEKHIGLRDFSPAITHTAPGEDSEAVWMKTESSPYILPVKMHRFPTGRGVTPLNRIMRRHWESTGKFPGRFDHHRVTP
ncbi:MAG: ATP-binding protein [Candidatus Latescibacterota bacterium]